MAVTREVKDDYAREAAKVISDEWVDAHERPGRNR